MLERSYPVKFGNKTIGKVQLNKIGMFYHLACNCSLPDDRLYRLFASCDTIQMPLGLLVGEKGGHALQKHIPCSAINPDKTYFGVQEQNQITNDITVISPEQEFAGLSALECARLEIQDNCYRISYH